MKNTVITKSTDGQNMTRIPTNELVVALEELKPNAFKLLMYYYSKNDGWEFRADVMARNLNIKASTVLALKRELVLKKYLLIIKGKVINYFVGKKAVRQYEEK